MKTTRIILLAATAALLSSCSLDIKQKSAIDSASMWQDESDFKAAMYGEMYSFRNAYKVNLSYWGDFRSGVMGPGLGSFNATAHVNNQLTSSEGKGTNWSTLYTCINDCNITLKHIDDILFTDEAMKARIMANSHFLRAYCYFTIVRTWGDAPLMLGGIESDKDDILPSRDPEADIYAQIAEDLDKAESLMPADVTDCTTANVDAIQMLIADYNLWMYKVKNGTSEHLAAAEAAVNKVLDGGRHELLPKFADVFSCTNKGNKEIIFTLRFIRTTEEFTTYYDDYLIPTSKYTDDASYMEKDLVKTGSQDQWYSFSETFQKFLYENEEDTRAAVSFAYYTVPETYRTYSWINKFPGEWESGVRYFTSDIPLYRYAETLLFKAEIENEKAGGDPLSWINKVAGRAYGKDDFYSGLSKEEINEVILNERLKEFAAEGKSWFDYIRLGYAFTKITSLVGRQGETNILLWPIAQDCFSDNPNIRQTVGYN